MSEGGIRSEWVELNVCMCDELIFGSTISDRSRLCGDRTSRDSLSTDSGTILGMDARGRDESFEFVFCERLRPVVRHTVLKLAPRAPHGYPKANLWYDHHPPFVLQAIECHYIHSNMHFHIHRHHAFLLTTGILQWNVHCSIQHTFFVLWWSRHFSIKQAKIRSM